MKRMIDRLSFFWDQSHATPGEVPTGEPDARAGAPRRLHFLIRLAITVIIATSLGQVIRVRLIAPVDAAPSYQAQCESACREAHQQRVAACQALSGPDQGACLAAAAQALQDCTRSCQSGP